MDQNPFEGGNPLYPKFFDPVPLKIFSAATGGMYLGVGVGAV